MHSVSLIYTQLLVVVPWSRPRERIHVQMCRYQVISCSIQIHIGHIGYRWWWKKLSQPDIESKAVQYISMLSVCKILNDNITSLASTYSRPHQVKSYFNSFHTFMLLCWCLVCSILKSAHTQASTNLVVVLPPYMYSQTMWDSRVKICWQSAHISFSLYFNRVAHNTRWKWLVAHGSASSTSGAHRSVYNPSASYQTHHHHYLSMQSSCYNRHMASTFVLLDVSNADDGVCVVLHRELISIKVIWSSSFAMKSNPDSIQRPQDESSCPGTGPLPLKWLWNAFCSLSDGDIPGSSTKQKQSLHKRVTVCKICGQWCSCHRDAGNWEPSEAEKYKSDECITCELSEVDAASWGNFCGLPISRSQQ